MLEKIESFNGSGEINFNEIFNMEDNKNYNATLDLSYKVKISKKEAIEGTRIKIKVKGRNIELTIPQNIKDGQEIVIKGEGDKINNQYGNLKIKVEIKRW